jgi:hypothetical protein
MIGGVLLVENLLFLEIRIFVSPPRWIHLLYLRMSAASTDTSARDHDRRSIIGRKSSFFGNQNFREPTSLDSSPLSPRWIHLLYLRMSAASTDTSARDHDRRSSFGRRMILNQHLCMCLSRRARHHARTYMHTTLSQRNTVK